MGAIYSRWWRWISYPLALDFLSFLYGLIMAGTEGASFLTDTADSVAGILLGITVTVGLGCLEASTVWYRLIKKNRRALGVCQALLQRV